MIRLVQTGSRLCSMWYLLSTGDVIGVEETMSFTTDSTSLSVVGVPSPGSFTSYGALDSVSAVNKDFPGTLYNHILPFGGGILGCKEVGYQDVWCLVEGARACGLFQSQNASPVCRLRIYYKPTKWQGLLSPSDRIVTQSQ